ncbi:endonuclease V [Ideonella sp. DXS29W]|uniref:Endonuclease V n=1 Tax=Ideonella lacteola TaxID=2984193 RepID=A0ABU9BI79_9BURK
MILALDVHYAADHSVVAGVAFDRWDDSRPKRSFVERLPPAAEYEPGRFYQRELPCLLTLIRAHDLHPHCVVIDGYVYLDGASEPGLGNHLYHALQATTAVVGVAKTSFRAIGPEFQVLRGGSERPLYVTSIGMALSDAKAAIAGMHGPHRLPTLLKWVDQLCRGRVPAGPGPQGVGV